MKKNTTRNYFEINKIKVIMYQNEWDVGKIVLMEKL